MAHQPLVSIITPTYMQGKYIKDCIESVKQQSYKNLEHIIYDACSVDTTERVVADYLGKYNLTYYREEDNGQAHALNKGFDKASGEIVCWLNSDDLYYNNTVIENVVDLFNKNTRVDVVSGGGILTDENGNYLSDLKASKHVCSLEKMKIYCHTLQPSTFWKKTDLRLDEGLNFTFDWKFFIEMLKNGYVFLVTEKKFSNYRQHSNSKTWMDSASRKRELALITDYAGSSFLQVKWCWFIYKLYLISEKSPLKFTLLAKILNRCVGIASLGRIGSY